MFSRKYRRVRSWYRAKAGARAIRLSLRLHSKIVRSLERINEDLHMVAQIQKSLRHLNSNAEVQGKISSRLIHQVKHRRRYWRTRSKKEEVLRTNATLAKGWRPTPIYIAEIEASRDWKQVKKEWIHSKTPWRRAIIIRINKLIWYKVQSILFLRIQKSHRLEKQPRIPR